MSRALLILFSAAIAAGGLTVVGTPPLPASAAPCDPPPLGNPIVCENQQPGQPSSEWDIPAHDQGDPSIQGFATDISVNKGQTVSFKINTPATAYTIDIYRMGYYGGSGARRQATISPSVSLPQSQPACLTQPSVGLIDCGNWAVSAQWTVPSTAVSGIYFAKLQRTDTGGVSHIIFIVRDDASSAPMLFQTSDSTWQAYNSYGGTSLYRDSTFGLPAGRAFKVSYNRPFNTRSLIANLGPRSFVWNSEYPMLRFLEANGYNLTYAASVDTDRRGVAALQQHQTFLSVGHDEYWSANQRANVEAARDAGVNLGFFSGNQMFWKTRWENSTDGSNTPYRTLVTYKETHANAKIDPNAAWTGTWRDPRFSPPADGGRPENAVAGTIFTVNGPDYRAMQVPYAYSRLRLWRNTSIASLAPGATQNVAAGCSCVLGHEWDEDLDNGFRPAGLIDLSSTTWNVPQYLQDYGSTFANGTATHSLTQYRAASGALVFSTGTVNWPWGLDTTHDVMGSATDINMQQATINILADMGAQPGTLRPGLVAATASTDTARPSSTIASPAAGANLPSGTPVTISGTATDAGGGQVGGVEVSLDGGTTWHKTSGAAAWSYSWTPSAPGQYTIRSRAADDSGNIEVPTSGINVTVGPRTCPCTMFPSTASPTVAANSDTNAVELGVKFQSDQAGFVQGIRFYKGATNTGTHVGNLWSSTGALLASATFTSETASGWQQVMFGSPVAIAANTTYVASYHAEGGHYSVDQNFFLTAPVDAWPLHGLRSGGPTGGNGVYAYGFNSAFPTNTYNASNYWVDLVFNTTSQVPTATPTPTATNTAVPTNTSVPTNTPTPGPPTNTPTPAPPTNTPTPTNTSVPTSCPCSVFGPSATPADEVGGSPVELGMKIRSDNPGYFTGIRFWKAPNETGSSHTLSLWNASGTLLGSATTSGESASGWQQANLTVPVAISANTTYVASYHSNGRYGRTLNAFSGSGVDNSPLHGLRDGLDGGNGVYMYSSSSTFPGNTYQGSNYFVDVVYNSTATVPTSTPTATPTNTSVPTNTPIPTNTPTPAPPTNTPTPGPPTSTPTPTNTSVPTTCPCSIWPPNATPATPAQSDTNSVEVGVKFRADRNGQITAIRFYKGSANTGSHWVNLWSSSGTLLATAPSTGETAAGWQTVNLPTPVAVTANTTYVASYHSASGRYAVNAGYFNTQGVTNGPLTALQTGVDGSNGVYAYNLNTAFPTSSFNASNYWVDVVFTAP